MTAQSGIVSGIAGRYATALFELAQEKGQLDDVEKDCGTLQGMIDESEDFGRLLRSPVFSAEDQQKALAAVLEQAGVSALTRQFAGVLVANRRLFALTDALTAFRHLLAEHRGEVVASVTSAYALSEQQLAAIKAELAAAMKTDVAVETSVDEDILGGLVVRVGSRMVDSSLKTKLNNLKYAMRGVE